MPSAIAPPQPHAAGGLRALHVRHAHAAGPQSRVVGVGGLARADATAVRAFTSAERFAKNKLFGCRMCAQCALPATGVRLSDDLPQAAAQRPLRRRGHGRQLRGLPRHALRLAQAYERADAGGSVQDLRRLQRPIDQRKWGQSSWVNYWLGRDEGLWTDDRAIRVNPPLHDH